MSLSQFGYSSMAIGEALDAAFDQGLIVLIDGKGWHLTEEGEVRLGQARESKDWVWPYQRSDIKKMSLKDVYVPPKVVISRLLK